MQNDIASFKDLVESRIIKIEKVDTDPFERDTGTEGLTHQPYNQSLPVRTVNPDRDYVGKAEFMKIE